MTNQGANKPALFLAACLLACVAVYANADNIEEPQAAAEAGAEAVKEAASDDEVRAAPEMSAGMYIPLDGSSLAAFDQSLEKIKEASTPADYETLTGAIDWHLMYDLAVSRDREKLARKLDGATGADVIGSTRRGKQK